MGNALAFDAKNLSTVNTVGLLTHVTKSMVIHGFAFTPALENALKECLTLGKHTGIIHFTPRSATKYLRAHKEMQPWGHKLPLQCPQCCRLNAWTLVFLEIGYQIECKHQDCGEIGGRRVARPFSFPAPRPQDFELLGTGTSKWLKFSAE